MATFRAIEKGYYGDVLHYEDHHEYFEAPDDFQASWAEKVDGDVPEPEDPEEAPEVLKDAPDEEGAVDDGVETL